MQLPFPEVPQRVAQEHHFAILRIEVTRASRGLSAIAELLADSTFALFMAALCNRAGYYIFALWFLSSSSIFFLA